MEGMKPDTGKLYQTVIPKNKAVIADLAALIAVFSTPEISG